MDEFISKHEGRNRNYTPEQMADYLKSEAEIPVAGPDKYHRVVTLNNNNGYFELQWSGIDTGQWDWVGLYKSVDADDDDYIAGSNWQWAENGQSYQTITAVEAGFQARYLVWNTDHKKYESVARSDYFPRIAVCSQCGPSVSPVVCLTYYDAENCYDDLCQAQAKFKLTWDVHAPEEYDWVGLYTDTAADDKSYIGGSWQRVSRGTYYETATPLKEGYQARYLRWFAKDRKYKSIAKTPAFPRIDDHSTADYTDSHAIYPYKAPVAIVDALNDNGFPNLNGTNVWITAPKTGKMSENPYSYNCFAWSMGFNDRWLNAATDMGRFVQFYRARGYESVPDVNDATVIGWAKGPDGNVTMTHASKKYTGKRADGRGDPITLGLWESKLGSAWRMTHARDGLTGNPNIAGQNAYGRPVIGFKLMTHLSHQAGESAMPFEGLSEQEEAVLNKQVGAVSPVSQVEFEKAFTAWQATWFTGDLEHSSNTYDFATGPEFDALLTMGSTIIPLVIEQLKDPDNFVALVLYEALAPSVERQIQYTEDDENILEGEQSRAQRTIHQWLAGRIS